jgi:hypothetical protein
LPSVAGVNPTESATGWTNTSTVSGTARTTPERNTNDRTRRVEMTRESAALARRYDNQVFDAPCPDCDEMVSNAPFLRAGLENRTDDDRANAFDAWTRRLVGLLHDGVCSWCASTVTHEFSEMERDGTGGGDEMHITHICDRCGGFLRTTPVENVIDHPAVVTFCYGRGIDLTAIPHWEVDGYVSKTKRLVSDDLVEVRVTIQLADDELTLSLDEEMRVREAE